MYLGASYKRLNRFSDSIWWFLSCSLLVCYHADCDIKPYWALVSLRITIIPFSSKNQNFKCRTRMLARGCSWMNSVSASGLHIKRIGPKKKKKRKAFCDNIFEKIWLREIARLKLFIEEDTIRASLCLLFSHRKTYWY